MVSSSELTRFAFTRPVRLTKLFPCRGRVFVTKPMLFSKVNFTSFLYHRDDPDIANRICTLVTDAGQTKVTPLVAAFVQMTGHRPNLQPLFERQFPRFAALHRTITVFAKSVPERTHMSLYGCRVVKGVMLSV